MFILFLTLRQVRGQFRHWSILALITWKCPLRRSRSFNVTDFSTNRKLICDFLLVINTNLPPILHRFQVMSEYWSTFRYR